MIDPAEPFPEGVKILQKDNFSARKHVPENYRCRVKRMSVIAESSVSPCVSV